MFLSRSSKPIKPLKPYKSNARGLVHDSSSNVVNSTSRYSGAVPNQTTSKEAIPRVPGKNIPKRRPRLQAPQPVAPVVDVPKEYDVSAVQRIIERQGAVEEHTSVSVAPLPATKPVKSSKIGLPKKAGGLSNKIQPKSNAVSTPTVAATPTVNKKETKANNEKTKKDNDLLSQLVSTVEPEEDDEDLLKLALGDGDPAEFDDPVSMDGEDSASVGSVDELLG